MSTISICPDAAPTKARRWLAGVSVPSAFGWNAMPAPLSAESYLPCKRRWNGSLTKAKYDWRPCDATVPPVRVQRQSEHLLRRVVREIGDGDERREEVRHRAERVGHHDDAARAGFVSFTERDPVSIAARRDERGVGERERVEVETQHRFRIAAAGDSLRDGVERNHVRDGDDTRLLTVGVIPDEERVRFSRRRQRRADADRVDVEQRVRLLARLGRDAVLPDLSRIRNRKRRIEPANRAGGRVGRRTRRVVDAASASTARCTAGDPSS